jgi:hypothetical protein
MIFNGLVGLLSRFKSAGSDDRNAVIGDSGVSSKTKSSYQMLSPEGVKSDVYMDSILVDSASPQTSESFSLNSLSKLVNSRLGIIRFLANGEMGDLDHQQLMEQFNEIDNQVEKLENELDQHSRGIRSVYKKEQQKKANNLLKKSVFDDYDDIT